MNSSRQTVSRDAVHNQSGCKISEFHALARSNFALSFFASFRKLWRYQNVSVRRDARWDDVCLLCNACERRKRNKTRVKPRYRFVRTNR